MGKSNPPIHFLRAPTLPSQPGSIVADRQPSRTPQPYWRRPLPSPRVQHVPSPGGAPYLPSTALTPNASRAISPLPRKPSYGGSESDTEAEDELARKLPAPAEEGSHTSSRRGGFTGKKMILLMATKTREADCDRHCPVVDAN